VRETVGKRGVKNHRQPIGGDELAVHNFKTCRNRIQNYAKKMGFRQGFHHPNFYQKTISFL
jgi:hypothetical protein